jgi:hypothetical protein
MNTNHDELEARVKRHLVDHLGRVDPIESGLEVTMNRGAQLRRRRQWLMVGGGVAAVVVGIVGAVALAAAFRGGDTEEVATEPAPALATVALDWFAIEGTLGWSQRTVTAPDGTFYALSTVPGRRALGPDSFEPAIYVSDDGAVWDFVPLDQDIYANDMAVRDDVIYLIGTAPGTFARGEVIATVSSTDDLGGSWDVTELPLAAAPPAELDVNWVWATTKIAASSESVVAVVTTNFDVDVRSLVPRDALGDTRDVQVTGTGVDIIDWSIFEQLDEQCGRLDPGDAELPEECDAFFSGDESMAVVDSFTWEELGVDASNAPAFTEVFVSDDGATFDPVASPFTPGQDLAGLYAVGADFYAFEHSGASWRSDDGRAWEPIGDLPFTNWVAGMGDVDGVPVIAGGANGRTVVAWGTPDGGWERVDLDPILDDFGVPETERWLQSASVGPLGAVVAIQSWDEQTGVNDTLLVRGSAPDQWEVVPLAGLLPTTQDGFSQWVMVGDDEVLVQFSFWNQAGQQSIELIGTPAE